MWPARASALGGGFGYVNYFSIGAAHYKVIPQVQQVSTHPTKSVAGR